MDPILEETAVRIFADHRHDPDGLWSIVDAHGLTRAWVGEAQGGYGLTPVDGFGLIRLAGAHAAPVPVAETLMASWFLGEAGIEPPTGRMSVLIRGFQRGIAFGDSAEHIVCIAGNAISLRPGHVAATLAAMGEDPLSDASQLSGTILGEGEMGSDLGLPFAALIRSAQICGALEAALTLTIQFAEQRIQFGRSLSKFQAIQHLLSEMGAETAAASAALDAAVAGVRMGTLLDVRSVAVAKFRTSLAAGIICEHAHQIHGAVGYTQEYALARLTRRLWQWRDDFGGESYWANLLGREALSGSGPLWPKLAPATDN
jgi:acyl-CoA dehydrogenase